MVSVHSVIIGNEVRSLLDSVWRHPRSFARSAVFPRLCAGHWKRQPGSLRRPDGYPGWYWMYLLVEEAVIDRVRWVQDIRHLVHF